MYVVPVYTIYKLSYKRMHSLSVESLGFSVSLSVCRVHFKVILREDAAAASLCFAALYSSLRFVCVTVCVSVCVYRVKNSCSFIWLSPLFIHFISLLYICVFLCTERLFLYDLHKSERNMWQNFTNFRQFFSILIAFTHRTDKHNCNGTHCIECSLTS